jgi:hypothetical protein
MLLIYMRIYILYLLLQLLLYIAVSVVSQNSPKHTYNTIIMKERKTVKSTHTNKNTTLNPLPPPNKRTKTAQVS